MKQSGAYSADINIDIETKLRKHAVLTCFIEKHFKVFTKSILISISIL